MKLVSMKKLRNRKGYGTVKSKDVTLLTKIHIVKAIVFPVVTYVCDSWTIKKTESQELMLSNCDVEGSWESLGLQGDQTSPSYVDQSWIFIGRTDAEAEVSILWPPDAKNWPIGKYAAAGKEWKQEKGMTECEMIGWHHLLNGHEFEQTPGDGEGQERLEYWSPWGCKESDVEFHGLYGPWGHKESDTTEQLPLAGKKNPEDFGRW